MIFNYHLNKKLPKLAWGTVILKGSNEINVYHGTGIETKKTFFVEGAWNDNFISANFDKSTLFMGSGARSTENGVGILFATSNHTLERLYTIKDQDIIYVSNSLPFILFMSNNKLKANYLDYESDFNTILKGISHYKNWIVLENNKKVKLHYYCNFYIENSFTIVEKPKVKSKPFNSYEDYYSSLIKDLKLFVSNAQSKYRNNKYGLVTTISKGYDAAACAAVAVDLGCDTAVSFNRPEKYSKDCGDLIANNLGYKKIITKNANEYLDNNKYIEAEFVSSGELGTGIIFTAFEGEFKNKIVFMGERGDKIWDKNRIDRNSYFSFNNEVFSGTSLIENRLRVGYIVMPMPLYRAENWPSIHKISNSKEMENYSIGGNYDRPIPRRIVESKGIDRDDFGIEKKGVGFNYRFDNLYRLKKRMSKKSYISFLEFYKSQKRNVLYRLKLWFFYLWNTKAIYINYIMKKIRIPYKYRPLSADACSNPGAPSYLIHWGNNIMIKRYKGSNIDRWWIAEEGD
ncbi:MAG: hypothetical protein ACOCRO_11260 [Halanaerobiales bacterium]